MFYYFLVIVENWFVCALGWNRVMQRYLVIYSDWFALIFNSYITFNTKECVISILEHLNYVCGVYCIRNYSLSILFCWMNTFLIIFGDRGIYLIQILFWYGLENIVFRSLSGGCACRRFTLTDSYTTDIYCYSTLSLSISYLFVLEYTNAIRGVFI